MVIRTLLFLHELVQYYIIIYYLSCNKSIDNEIPFSSISILRLKPNEKMILADHSNIHQDV